MEHSAHINCRSTVIVFSSPLFQVVFWSERKERGRKKSQKKERKRGEWTDNKERDAKRGRQWKERKWGEIEVSDIAAVSSH